MFFYFFFTKNSDIWLLSSGKECNADLKDKFCHNGGTCHKEDTMGEYYCM